LSLWLAATLVAPRTARTDRRHLMSELRTSLSPGAEDSWQLRASAGVTVSIEPPLRRDRPVNLHSRAPGAAKLNGVADGVVFAVLTGAIHHRDRAEFVKETWCSRLDSCVFVSDERDPSLHNVVITLENLPAGVDGYQRAQLRFLPALNYMRDLLLSRGDGHSPFGRAKWLVVVDDDTFVFYNNLHHHLATLDASRPIYTGDVFPREWLPVKMNGNGGEVGAGVSSDFPFVNGGGGSIFSRGALEQMDTMRCLNHSMPGQKWWRWQSDWMIGACAAEAGISPYSGLLKGKQGLQGDGESHGFLCMSNGGLGSGALQKPCTSETRFNQFACTEADVMMGCEHVGKGEAALYPWPATMHPVRRGAAMLNLYNYYPNSTEQGVPMVRMQRVNDATVQTPSATRQYFAEGAGILLS